MTLDALSVATIIQQALDNLRGDPKNLARHIEFLAGENDVSLPSSANKVLIDQLSASGPNDSLRHALIKKLQHWDHEGVVPWSKGAPHSDQRRRDCLDALGFAGNEHATINAVVPRFSETQIPIVIAEAHEPWYEKARRQKPPFYWKHYEAQLAKPKGSWESEAVAALDLSTDDVISRLSDPARSEVFMVKGLVMGYVQSGKTSHFSGLIAKAADAGYKLIIVFAGTMDILRQQTQRRIDKEIVGKEILGKDEYGADTDWAQFVEHGGRPSENGMFDFERLTDRSGDYSDLGQLIHALNFRRTDPTKPINHPDNLRFAPVRLAVIKKTPKRIASLCSDLKRLKELRTALEFVPTLVIDDESDQASVNTVDRSKPGNSNGRTSTNKAIGDLLRLLPRAQYVGYTATPFANVFIDPKDADDLFPKDFIVSLPRPEGYMGVSDFYDFDTEYPEGDFRSNREAFVRPVEGPNDKDANLPSAIDSFVLAGAIKLYREARGDKPFRHHTMLVHHSSKKVVHKEEAEEVAALFAGGARYQRKAGIEKLRNLFEKDFLPVSKARAPKLPFPRSFDDLKSFVSDCITRICDEKPVLIVNGDNKDDTPDFDQKSVWAILVGGAKLSRGYTVEGLTTSYYRRPAGAGDTLMQMGRWFGFRPGYKDLVRLYIGKSEKKGKLNVDLYEAFGAVCRDEEALRAELLKYGKGGLTPKQVPPLVRQHLPSLPPTSRNKMFNAQIASRDFGGAWTEKTQAPTKDGDVAHNLGELATLLLTATRKLIAAKCALTNSKGAERKFEANIAIVPASAVISFLGKYRWSEPGSAVHLEQQYLTKEISRGRLQEWLVLLPQAQGKTFPLPSCGFPKLAIVERSRASDTRFGAYSEPRHRDAAEYLAGVSEGTNVSDALVGLRNAERGVLIVYLVADKANPKAGVSVGFGVQFPGVKADNAILWTVTDPSQKNAVVVDPKKPKVRK